MVAEFKKPVRDFDRLVPPQNVEIEEALLGCLLALPQSIEMVIDDLKPEAFYITAHQHIYRAAVGCHLAGRPCDMLAVTDWLGARNLLESIGGQGRIADLVDLAVGSYSVDSYAAIIREKYDRRCLIQAAESMIALAMDGSKEWAEVRNESEKKILNLSEGDRIASEAYSDVLARVLVDIEKIQSEGVSPATGTGFYDLDGILNGGFFPGKLIVLGGRPAMGKSALAGQIAANIAQRKPVAFFSLEMAKEELAHRFLASETEIESGRISAGRILDEEWSVFGKVYNEQAKWQLSIDDRETIAPSDVLRECRKIKARQGGLGLVVVDYLHLMADGDSQRVEEDQKRLTRYIRQCKRMARELQAPVLILSQLNREVESQSDKRPALKDLRQTGAIEQDADIVLFLYRDEYYNANSADRGLAEVIVAKNRGGATGTVKLLFDGQYTRFRNLMRGLRG